MAGFLYFVRGRKTVTQPDLVAIGLGHAFDRVHPEPVVCEVIANGPDGHAGCVAMTAGSDVGRCRVDLGQQTWRRYPPKLLACDNTEVWIGHWTADPPTPADLARETQLKGHAVELGDGRRWLCPAARSHIEQDGDIRYVSELPSGLGLSEDGDIETTPFADRYGYLWQIALDFFDLLSKSRETETGVTLTIPTLADWAVKALSANYRIGRVEAMVLGIFASEMDAYGVLRVVSDWNTFVELCKKKAGAGG